MKILHTSDWHLGQHFMGQSRKAEHQAFLNWLLEQAEQLDLDAIIVAGDIFDTATPPSYARRLYNEFVVALQASRCQLIILAGNHDSPATLAESEGVFACLNTLVVANKAESLGSHIKLLKTKATDQVAAILCAVPFVRSRELQVSEALLSGREKQQGLADAIADFYRRLYQQALDTKAELGLDIPIIGSGHLTLLGGKSSDSVRDIYIGQLEALNANLLPEFDYLALGHLHKAQQVNANPHWRYSGSPIALSFDEAGVKKQVEVLTLTGAAIEVESLAVPCFQRLVSLQGNLAQLEREIETLKQAQQSIWLSIEVAEQDYLPDLQVRLQALLADSQLELLRLKRQRDYQTSVIAPQQKTLAELLPLQVFQQRLEQEDLAATMVTQLTEKFSLCLSTAQQALDNSSQQDVLDDIKQLQTKTNRL